MAAALDESDWLDHVMDRLIPDEEGFPGARQTGCASYVRTRWAGASATIQAEVRAGLDRIAAEAAKVDAHPFNVWAPEAQDAFLSQFEHEPFFVRLVEWTSEGFYADPGQGGNRGEASWRMIGFNPAGGASW